MAEPLTPEEVERLATDAAEAQRSAEAKGDRSPRFAVEAERLKDRYRELALGGSTGMWNVSLVAGSATERDAVRVAALVAASLELDGLPYTLKPARAAGFVAGSRLVAALMRPPA